MEVNVSDRNVQLAAEFGKRLTYTKLRPARPRMIRLTSRVVKPPASGVPAANLKIFQEEWYELLFLCSLAGAKPGSNITNERINPMFVIRLAE